MKNKFFLLIVWSYICVFHFEISAQLGTYTFTDYDTLFPSVSNCTFSQFIRVNVDSSSGYYNDGEFKARNWNTTNNIDESEYIEFFIAPNVQYTLHLSNVDFDIYGSNTIADTFKIAVSLDNFLSVHDFLIDSIDNVLQAKQWNFSDISSDDTVKFRIYIYGKRQADGEGIPSSAGVLKVDNVKVFGSVATCIIPSDINDLNLFPSSNSIEVSWSNPHCFDQVLVVIKSSTSILKSPSGTGDLYFASSIYGEGTRFGGGNIVYKSMGTSISITGLMNDIIYHVKVFVRKNQLWSDGIEGSTSPSGNTPILIDDFDGVDDKTFSTEGTWLVNSDEFEAQTGGLSSPEHSFASFDLSQLISGWELVSTKENTWFCWMDLNRSDPSGWGASNYSCGFVLAANSPDFNNTSVSGYLIGFNSNDNLYLWKFSNGIHTGQTASPENSTEILNTGYTYNDGDDGVNIYIEHLVTGKWKVYFKAGPKLTESQSVNKINYTDGNVTSALQDITYSGVDFKFSGFVYAHSSGGSEKAYFDNFGAGQNSVSAVYVWEGDDSTNPELWNVAENWNTGIVPNSSEIDIHIKSVSSSPEINDNTLVKNLIIENGATLTINAGKVLNASGAITVNGNLIIESNAVSNAAMLDDEKFSGSGTITINHFLEEADRYYYLTPTATNVQPNDEFSTAEALYKWNETSYGIHGWNSISLTSNNDLIPGVGYAVKYLSGNQTLSFAGNSISGDQTADLTYSHGESKAGFNLIGNPFPSPIDWLDGSWTKPADLRNNTIWYRTTNGARVFATFNGNTEVGTNGAQRYIPSGQAFWVQYKNNAWVSNYSTQLTIPDAARTANLHSFYKNANSLEYLRISVSRDSLNDEALICFHPQADESFDIYDSEKMFESNPEMPILYSYPENENKELVINTFQKLIQLRVVPLMFETEVAGDFKFSFSDIESFDNNISIFLEDQLNGNFIDLNQNSEYDFSSAISDDKRFVLYFSPIVTGLDTLNEASPVIFSENSNIHVQNLSQSEFALEITDILGRVVYYDKICNKQSSAIFETRLDGCYIVKLKSDNSVISKLIYF